METTHHDLIDFLIGKGWTQFKESKTHTFILFKPPAEMGFSPDFTFPVPCSTKTRDYKEALQFAIKCVANYYDKTADELILELIPFYWLLDNRAIAAAASPGSDMALYVIIGSKTPEEICREANSGAYGDDCVIADGKFNLLLDWRQPNGTWDYRDIKPAKHSVTFEKRDDGFYCQVNDVGKMFLASRNYGQWSVCERNAKAWINDQCVFQDETHSAEACNVSGTRLMFLVNRVRAGFRRGHEQFEFMIDEHAECFCVCFGCLLVTESNGGYNIELVTNWLTKDRDPVCSNVTIEVAEAVILNSPASHVSKMCEPRRLYLSEKNRVIFETFKKMP